MIKTILMDRKIMIVDRKSDEKVLETNDVVGSRWQNTFTPGHHGALYLCTQSLRRFLVPT